MAAPSRHFCRLLTPFARRICTKRKRGSPCLVHIHAGGQQAFRSFSSFRADQGRANGPSNSSSNDYKPRNSEIPQSPELADIDSSDLFKPVDAVTANDLDPDEHERFKSMTPREQENYLAISSHFKALLESPETEEELEEMTRSSARDIDRQQPFDFPEDVKLRPKEVGYWADEEPDELGDVEDADDDFKEEYITSVAENELELQREIREYARIAAWDMPLLSKYAKPYEAPAAANKPLRFRYTTYMGESHPASRKVVVELRTRDLVASNTNSSASPDNQSKTPTLTEPQRLKLLKLAGPRYNPDTDTIKISTEQFEHPAQNKRYLGDVITKLLAEARDNSSTADHFEDVPLDQRHHRRKPRPNFPDEWNLTPDRVKVLMEVRRKGNMIGGDQERRLGQEEGGDEQTSRIGSASSSAKWMERMTQRVPVPVRV